MLRTVVQYQCQLVVVYGSVDSGLDTALHCYLLRTNDYTALGPWQ